MTNLNFKKRIWQISIEKADIVYSIMQVKNRLINRKKITTTISQERKNLQVLTIKNKNYHNKLLILMKKYESTI